MFYVVPMDWTLAIDRHREPLLRIVATLFAMIGLTDGGLVERLARPRYRRVLALLRPAEAAVRRLIIAAARDLVVKPRVERPEPKRPAGSRKGKHRRSFRLFDPLPGHGRSHGHSNAKHVEPRIRFFDADPLSPLFRRAASPPLVPDPKPESARDSTVKAKSLCRRLDAIRHALQDLPRQARRYARWRAKAAAESNPQIEKKLRLRRLPFLVRKTNHEVHAILTECEWLARTALAPDSS